MGERTLMQRMADRVRQWLCSHEVFIEDIKRQDHLTDELYLVEGLCHRCGASKTAPYGLALKAKLTWRTPPTAVRAARGTESKGEGKSQSPS